MGALAAALLLSGTRAVEGPVSDGTPIAVGALAPVPIDPMAFAPGGCVAWPARVPRAVVMLDAGHGGPDPGSLGTTVDGREVAEKELTLAVTLAVAARLRDRGVTAVLSRATDDLGSTLASDDLQDGALTTAASQQDLVSRVRCANLARADALVSIHFNSFDDPSVSGTETLYDTDRALAPRSRTLAQALQADIRAGLASMGRPSPDRGVVDDSSGGEAGGGHLVLLGPRIPGRVDEPSAMPGALVEPLFMTSPPDLSTVATPRGADVLASAIQTGIEDYLGDNRR